MKIRRTLDDIIKIMANTTEEDNAQRDSNSPLTQTNIICVDEKCRCSNCTPSLEYKPIDIIPIVSGAF